MNQHNLLQKVEKLFKKIYIGVLFKRNHLKFKIAKAKEDLELVYHLRWRIYGQELEYINPNDYPDQKYSDKYDKYSVNFLAFVGNKPVGALRLIFHSPLGFYIERDFPIVQSPIKPEEIAELSQFTILKEYRGGRRLVSFGLLKKAFEFSKQKGITHWYALMGEKLKNSFEKYGIQINPLSYGEFTENYLKEREIMSNYYKKVRPLPYLISLKEVEKIL